MVPLGLGLKAFCLSSDNVFEIAVYRLVHRHAHHYAVRPRAWLAISRRTATHAHFLVINKSAVIQSPLRPTSLTHKNSQGRRLILMAFVLWDTTINQSKKINVLEECPVCKI